MYKPVWRHKGKSRVLVVRDDRITVVSTLKYKPAQLFGTPTHTEFRSLLLSLNIYIPIQFFHFLTFTIFTIWMVFRCVCKKLLQISFMLHISTIIFRLFFLMFIALICIIFFCFFFHIQFVLYSCVYLLFKRTKTF